MITNHSRQLPLLILTAGLLTVTFRTVGAQTVEEQIEILRGALKVERQAFVAENLQFTEAESKAFWPLYHKYRAEMDEVGDGLVKLAREFSGHYLDMQEERARKLLKQLGDFEQKYAATRTSYFKKISKVLPTSKTLRFVQVETRQDLAVRLELAASLPLVSVTK